MLLVVLDECPLVPGTGALDTQLVLEGSTEPVNGAQVTQLSFWVRLGT